MRLFSTAGSVRRGELSALAIAETIAASGLSFWLAWWLSSIQHIVVASALVPFLLLRTRLSTWYAVRLWMEIARRLYPSHVASKDLEGVVVAAMLPFVMVIALPFIKIFATTRIFFDGHSSQRRLYLATS